MDSNPSTPSKQPHGTSKRLKQTSAPISPTKQTAAIVKTPSRLPYEIWLDIFERLDYFSLKKCERVCKTFQSLVACSSLDNVLFRSNSEPLLDPKDIGYPVLHPAIEELTHQGTSSLAHMYFRLSGTKTVDDKDVCENDTEANDGYDGVEHANEDPDDEYEDCNCYDSSDNHIDTPWAASMRKAPLKGSFAAAELATFPAQATLIIVGLGSKRYQGRNATGVTVLQVAKGLCRLLTRFRGVAKQRGARRQWTVAAVCFLCQQDGKMRVFVSFVEHFQTPGVNGWC